jgi:hypothetical protein
MNMIVVPIEDYERDRRARRWLTARELDAMAFAPIKYVVPDWLVEGLTLFAGAPKIGKSWLVLEMALAVAAGGCCLGTASCEPGEVLYLALEDNRRRLQSRIRRLWGDLREPAPERLHIATQWPRANEGGIAALRDWAKERPLARLIVIDVLAMFKAMARGSDRTSLYEADYLTIKELQALAAELGVAIVVVHHTRKSAGELDPFEKVSGTLGLSGAADTTIVLDRDQSGFTAYGRGRDITEFETAMQFNKTSCSWRVLGEASEVRRSDERTTILTALAEAGAEMSPSDLAGATGIPENNVRQLLFKMARAGEVVREGRGRYLRQPGNIDNGDTGPAAMT